MALWQTATQIGVVLLVLMLGFVLLVRPQLKRMAEHQRLLDSLQIGDHVLIRGGLIGNIVGFKNADVVDLAIATSTTVHVDRHSIERKLRSDFGHDFKDSL
jgi:preprotein translocase subunit YajC